MRYFCSCKYDTKGSLDAEGHISLNKHFCFVLCIFGLEHNCELRRMWINRLLQKTAWRLDLLHAIVPVATGMFSVTLKAIFLRANSKFTSNPSSFFQPCCRSQSKLLHLSYCSKQHERLCTSIKSTFQPQKCKNKHRGSIFTAQFKTTSLKYTWLLNLRSCHKTELNHFHMFCMSFSLKYSKHFRSLCLSHPHFTWLVS